MTIDDIEVGDELIPKHDCLYYFYGKGPFICSYKFPALGLCEINNNGHFVSPAHVREIIRIPQPRPQSKPMNNTITITLQRNPNGRFVSTRQKPNTFRQGSLYAIKRRQGTVIARLKKVVDNEYAAFSVHKNRPFIASRRQITLATKDEVNQYLNN